MYVLCICAGAEAKGSGTDGQDDSPDREIYWNGCELNGLNRFGCRGIKWANGSDGKGGGVAFAHSIPEAETVLLPNEEGELTLCHVDKSRFS